MAVVAHDLRTRRRDAAADVVVRRIVVIDLLAADGRLVPPGLDERFDADVGNRGNARIGTRQCARIVLFQKRTPGVRTRCAFRFRSGKTPLDIATEDVVERRARRGVETSRGGNDKDRGKTVVCGQDDETAR